MRSVGLLLCVILLLATCGDAANQAPASPEDAARLAVVALKQNRFELCEPMLLTADDLQWLVDKMRAGESRKAREIVDRYEEVGLDAMLEEVHGVVRKSFEGLRKEGAAEGVAWDAMRFDRLHKLETETIDGVEGARCYIRIVMGDKPGEIRMGTMIRAPRGWILIGAFKS